MRVVLTVCGAKHIKYLESCKQSVKDIGWKHLCAIDSEHKGKGYYMNLLLKKVDDNDIVGVLDADDLATKDWAKNAELIGKHDLVYGDTLNLDENGSTERYHSREFDFDLFKKKNFIPFSGVLIKGWLAKKVSYPNIVHAADWLYWHKLLQHSRNWKYVSNVCAKRRVWTSYRKSNIPVYRKLRRLYREYKVKKLIKQCYK